MRTLFVSYLSAVWHWMDKKIAAQVVVLFILIVFGDTLLPLIGHALHILLELIDSTLEHFLELTFHTTKRQAQVILFYNELVITCWLAWMLLRKAYFTTLRAIVTARASWHALRNSARVTAWLKAALMVSALGASLFLFT